MARKLRLGLTALAIVIGVSFVSGTFILTDTLKAAFRDLFSHITNVDAVVRGKTQFARGEDVNRREPIPESVAATVRAVPGVKAAEGSVTGFAQMLDRQGKGIGTQGPPKLGVSFPDAPELQTFHVKEGRRPSGGGEVAIDAGTASRHDFHVGDTIRIAFQGPARQFTVVGTVAYEDLDSLGGATLAAFDLATAQDVLGRVGLFDEVGVVAQPDVSQDELASRIDAALGGSYDVATGESEKAEAISDIEQGLNFFNTALLVFAVIALFVGSFIIFNTFSIIVAQRLRELALLRAVGAQASQVMRSVLFEAVVVGLFASLIGLLAGDGLVHSFDTLVPHVGPQVLATGLP